MYFHDDSNVKFVLQRQQRQQGFVGAYHSNPGKSGIIALDQGHPPLRGGIKKKILVFYDYSPKGGRGGLGKSEISLSEKTEIFLA